MVIVVFLFTDQLIKITQFKKINYLSKQEIILELVKYKLKITGEDLFITYFYSEEIFIKGKLLKVEILWK